MDTRFYCRNSYARSKCVSNNEWPGRKKSGGEKRCKQTKWIHLRLLLNCFSDLPCSWLLLLLLLILRFGHGKNTQLKLQIRRYVHIHSGDQLGVASNLQFSVGNTESCSTWKWTRLFFFPVSAWFSAIASSLYSRCCFCWFLKLIALVNVASHLIAARIQCNHGINFFFCGFRFLSLPLLLLLPLVASIWIRNTANVNSDRHVQISPSNVIALIMCRPCSKAAAAKIGEQKWHNANQPMQRWSDKKTQPAKQVNK